MVTQKLRHSGTHQKLLKYCVHIHLNKSAEQKMRLRDENKL